MYSFEVLDPLDAESGTLQVVYVSHIYNDERLVSRGFSEIVEGYNRRIPPSRLLFICPQGIESHIKACYDRGGSDMQVRLTSAVHVAVAPFDSHGQLVKEQVSYLKPNSDPWDIDDSLVERLSTRVVQEIFDSTESVLYAPHGYSFRKISGHESDIFVRAGNMLREPDCIAVFAFLLLRKIPTNCERVYIDSFTILSFALGLQSLVSYFRREDNDLPNLAIENFHSYHLKKEFRIPNEDNYMVLISASTTGKLADKLVEEMDADRARITHILGVGPKDSTFRESCVFFESRNQSARSDSPKSGQNTVIEIGTEDFIVSQSPPSPVRITHNHVNPDGARELYKAFYTKSLRLGESTADSVYSTFSLKLEDGDAKNPPIRQWIQESLIHDLPASTRVLVHMDDPMSRQLCTWINESLPSSVDMLLLKEFVEAKSGKYDGTVAIIAYQDPRLESLWRASIELRKLPSINRHFVIGYAFPSTLSEHRRLKNDLQFKSAGQQYGWSEFLVLPIGDASLHDSLVDGSPVIDKELAEVYRTDLGNILANELAKRDGRRFCSNNLAFLPNTNGEHLNLRHGSIFFRCSNAVNASQVAVYAMVSSALQSAREARVLKNSNLLPHERFDANPFVRKVLDPSMFARYSDGILQASLLRATQESELDYSASKELSQQFASICESLFLNHKLDAGEASLEFVYALASDKVLLRCSDFKRLRHQIDLVPSLHAFWCLLKTASDFST